MAKISKAQAGKSLKPGQRLTESGKVVSGKEAKRVTALEKAMVSELTKRGPVWDTTTTKKSTPKKNMKMGGKLKKAQGGMSIPAMIKSKIEDKQAEKYKKGGTVKAKGGKQMIKRADGSYSQRGLWDNIRAAKGSGKKPTAAMLKQEKKIKAKSK
jgi:muconolactone delta-isomerase